MTDTPKTPAPTYPLIPPNSKDFDHQLGEDYFLARHVDGSDVWLEAGNLFEPLNIRNCRNAARCAWLDEAERRFAEYSADRSTDALPPEIYYVTSGADEANRNARAWAKWKKEENP